MGLDAGTQALLLHWFGLLSEDVETTQLLRDVQQD